MKNLSNVLKIAFILTLLVAIPSVASAHYTWCGIYRGGSCTCGGGGYSTPLDGGLSVLLVAGAAYGSKRYAKYKKNNKEK